MGVVLWAQGLPPWSVRRESFQLAMPFALLVLLETGRGVSPNGGRTLSILYGNEETQLPTFTDHFHPSHWFAHGSGGPGTRFG